MTATTSKGRGWRPRRPIITRANALDVLNRVLTLTVLVVVGVIAWKWQQYAKCNRDYLERTATASQARAQAADQDRQAEDAMWQAFADAGDPTKVKPADAQAYAKTAFEKFLVERAAARKQRAEHPAPAPPSQVCR